MAGPRLSGLLDVSGMRCIAVLPDLFGCHTIVPEIICALLVRMQ